MKSIIFIVFMLFISFQVNAQTIFYNMVGKSVSELYSDWGEPSSVVGNSWYDYSSSNGVSFAFIVSNNVITNTMRNMIKVSKKTALADQKNAESGLLAGGFYFTGSSDGVRYFKKGGLVARSIVDVNITGGGYDSGISIGTK